MTVWYKQGVFGDLQIPCQKALHKIHDLHQEKNLDVYVTSIRDGNHMAGSLHYIGHAFDIRDDSYNEINIVSIKKILGDNFDVIKGRGYFHIEYDPK